MNVALELGCRNNLGIAVGRVKVLSAGFIRNKGGTAIMSSFLGRLFYFEKRV